MSRLPGIQDVTPTQSALLNNATQAILVTHGTTSVVERGDRLISAGTQAESMYFLLQGRLHVMIQDRIVAEIAAGQPVGEIAFFTGGTRTADVVAARDSEVLELDRAGWDAVSRLPDISGRILASLAQRLGAAVPHVPQLAPTAPKVVVLVAAGGGGIPEGFATAFANAMFGTAPLRLRDLPDEAASDSRAIVRWLHDQESSLGQYVVWIEEPGMSAFADAALRQSDLAILIADTTQGADPQRLGAVETEALRHHRPETRRLIVLREPQDPINGTSRWLAQRPAQGHHHIAGPVDIDRAASLIAGRGLGLVMAGGGALCCAHLGAVRALREIGVRIDTYAGTSGGAAMAIALASGLEPQEVLDRSQQMFVRSGALKKLTVPIHALLDHHPFDRQLRLQYGETQMEDLPVPALAVSASLTKNDVKLHRTGPVWKAVRASSSLPGLLPPVVEADGEVLVDGGIVDNLPIGPLQKIKLGPNLILGLGQLDQWRLSSRYEDLPNRFALARDIALRRHDGTDFPRIMQVLQKSMGITSRRALAAASMAGNTLIVPPIPSHLGIMDWHAGVELEAIGYAHMRAQIDVGALDEITRST